MPDYPSLYTTLNTIDIPDMRALLIDNFTHFGHKAQLEHTSIEDFHYSDTERETRMTISGLVQPKDMGEIFRFRVKINTRYGSSPAGALLQLRYIDVMNVDGKYMLETEEVPVATWNSGDFAAQNTAMEVVDLVVARAHGAVYGINRPEAL